MRHVLKAAFWGGLILAICLLIANLPGQIAIDAGPWSVEARNSVALTVVVLGFLALYLLLRLIATVVGMSRFHSLWRGGRRRRAGELAVTRGLVALAAGEKADARREAARARALLGDTPQTLLLTAEAGRLSGRDDEAAAALRALAARKDAAFLGLRGLLAAAVARQDWVEAAALARQAEAAHPGAAWLRGERAQLAIRAGDWGEALSLAAHDRQRAALAAGAARTAASPDQAERLLRQALKAEPGFTPAVLDHARLLRAKGREKKALATLTDGWTRAPHPDIADLALEPVTDKVRRVQVGQSLTAGQKDHPETHLLLARLSLDAGMLAEARRHLDAALAGGLDQRRVWLLRAELEEEDRGGTEEGRTAQRDALRRAATANADPEWRCTECHAPQPAWRAACPVCLAPGSIRWGTASGHTEAVAALSHAG
jgi:HemY protein